MRYLKEYRRVTYINLLVSDRLNSYLADIEKQAEEMFSRLVVQMADRGGVTKQLKATDQMLWTQRMSNIQARAREIVNTALIFS